MDFVTDDNNNRSGEKSYSLRPRSTSKREKEDVDGEEDTWKPRNRSRKRLKQKSAPLSKYRRKTANARERSRMREINDAFETLRKSIPHLAPNCDNSNEKISKIMTLRLAMKYITALSNALEAPESYCLESQMSLMQETSSTCSSLSDHSPWRERPSDSAPAVPTSLACAVVSDDSLSRLHTASRTLTTIQSESLPQGDFTHFFINRPSEVASRTSFDSPRTVFDKRTPPLVPDSRVPEFSRHTLTPPDDPPLQLPFEDLQPSGSSSTVDFQSSSFFNTDFDGLPSPVMDFCDLFIT